MKGLRRQFIASYPTAYSSSPERSQFQSAAHSRHQIKSSQATKHEVPWARTRPKPDEQGHARLIMEMSSDWWLMVPCEVPAAEKEKCTRLVRAICLQCVNTCDNFEQHLHGNYLNSCDFFRSLLEEITIFKPDSGSWWRGEDRHRLRQPATPLKWQKFSSWVAKSDKTVALPPCTMIYGFVGCHLVLKIIVVACTLSLGVFCLYSFGAVGNLHCSSLLEACR